MINSYKILIGSKPLRNKLDKIDRYCRVCYGTINLLLFGDKNMMQFTKRIYIV